FNAASATGFFDELLCAPSAHPDELVWVVSLLRATLVEPEGAGANAKALAIHEEAWRMVRDVAERTSRRYCDLEAKYRGKKAEDLTEEDRVEWQGADRILDAIANDIYHGSGA